MAHHIEWFLHYGEWPRGIVDHINGNNRDNRIANLRIASKAENTRNSKPHRDNTSGEKGVKIDKINHTWQVRVFAGKCRVYANASSKMSAIVAARLIRRVLHGEFAFENRPTT